VSAKLYEDKATGVKKGERCYGEIVAMKVQTEKGNIHQPFINNLVSLQDEVIKKNPFFTRVFYLIRERHTKQGYAVAIRAVQTLDFLTATVANIQWKTLNNIAEKVLAACPNVSSIYYDVTPKPPATIEME
jgi:GMP synthase PP-ATPase subunit